MPKTTCRLLAALSAIVFATTSQAETFDYRPDMQVRLGETWNPLSPFSKASLSSCFDVVLPDTSPTASDSISESFVESFAELEQKAQVSLTASGSSSFGLSSVEVDASMDTLKEAFSSNKSIIYSVVATRSYDTVSVLEADLNERGQKRLDRAQTESKPSAFYKPCGQALVTGISTEASVSVVYVFHFSDQSKREEMRAAISAAASYGASEGSASSNIMTAVRSVETSTQVEVLAFQNGKRDETTSLTSLLTTAPGDIATVRKAMRDAVEAIEYRNAQIKRFSADPISNFFDIPEESDWAYVSRAYNSLNALKGQADRIVRRYFRLEDMLDAVERNEVTFRDGMQAALLSEQTELRTRLAALSDKARGCFKTPENPCQVDSFAISNELLKFVNVDFGGQLGWDARVFGNYYDSHGERLHRSVAFSPRFNLRNRALVRSVTLLQNGNVVAFLEGERLAGALDGTLLSFTPFWESIHGANDYCWRGDWTGCNNWAADAKRHRNEMKGREASFNYRVDVADTDGGVTSIDLANASGISF